MLLLVGLGNPGPQYANNRHNIGFMAVDEIVRRHGFSPWRSRFQAQVAEGHIGAHRVLAIKPQTFMNESGRAVGEAVRFYKLESDQVIVIYDEIDLRFGKVKVKTGGGAGGHNGIRSLDAHIGRDYRRVRLGIDRPEHKEQVHGHVLQDFAKAERPGVEKLIDAVVSELPLLLDGDEGSFMSRVAFLTAPPRRPKPKPAPKPEAKPDSDSATPEDGADGL
jgi:PTH1 family peptidyl-tRNA hydrolase